MKVLHLMWEEKHTKRVAAMYDTFFNNGEHEICFLNKPGCPSLIENGFTIRQMELFVAGSLADAVKMISVFKNYDYIVVHSFKLSSAVVALLLMQPKLCRKLVWIEWGFDLYSWKSNNKGLKTWFKNKLNYAIRCQLGNFIGIFPPDCTYFKEQFPKAKAKVFFAPYCGATAPEKYENYSDSSRLEQTRKDQDTVYIQVGHYALNKLNHIQTLQMLEKWKDENIMLFLPLSYGNMEYADKVQKYAEETFPGKTLILREMMEREAYFELLKRVDIGIFNTTRQCGLGNIKQMVFRNVKLYMPEGSVMHDYFCDNGVPVQPVSLLATESFDAFTKPVRIQEQEKFDGLIKQLTDINYNVNFWKVIYDTLRAQG